MIRLSHVNIQKSAIDSVTNLMLQGNIGQSSVIGDFERAFADWIGSKYAIAVCNGTMADTIALAVLKHLNPGKTEVLVPALTFIAQVNAITYNGLTPVFYDRFSPVDLIDKNNVLCFFPVHLLGKPAVTTRPRDIPMIEDTCEAMGSSIWGRKCGTIGDMGTFSFFPSHTITTGEGGMIVTNNEEYATLAKRLRNHGKQDNSLFHFDVIGFNGKMTAIQAAIGLEALKYLDSVIQRRRENFYYLGGVEAGGELISPHAYPVICKSREERDSMLQRLTAAGIECRNLFSSIPTQEIAYRHLGYKLGDFPIAEYIGNQGLYVPCHQGLMKEDLDKIKEIIDEKEAKTTEVLVNAN